MKFDQLMSLRTDLVEFATSPNLNLNEAEKAILQIFVTNVSSQVYAFNSLAPGELVGGVISRSSRASGDLRSVLLRDFVSPLLSSDPALGPLLNILSSGEVDLSPIVNNPKARAFFIKWYSAYGDKSIADVVNISFGLTKVSLLATRIFMQSRPGFAAIEKSSRYLDVSKLGSDGNYPFFIPPNLKNFGLFGAFQRTMSIIFEKFDVVKSKYFEILKLKFSDDASVTENMLKTKVFDDLRHLVPLCTFTQFGLSLSARQAEYLISKLISSNLGEARFLGASLFDEARLIIPSLMTSLASELGLEYLDYMKSHAQKESNLAADTFADIEFLIPKKFEERNSMSIIDGDVTCVDFDPLAEEKVIASILFRNGLGDSFESNLAKVRYGMKPEMKQKFFDELFEDRKYRFYILSRDFEMGDLTLEFQAPFNVIKDLRRHRMCTTIEQKLITESIGYRPDLFSDSKYLEINNLMDQIYLLSKELHDSISPFDKETAQYALLQGNLAKWIVKVNLRSLFQQVELRTSSQGATDYREIMHSVARIAVQLYPSLARHLLVDFDSYEFARRGEDVTTANRLKRMEQGIDKLAK